MAGDVAYSVAAEPCGADTDTDEYSLHVPIGHVIDGYGNHIVVRDALPEVTSLCTSPAIVCTWWKSTTRTAWQRLVGWASCWWEGSM